MRQLLYILLILVPSLAYSTEQEYKHGVYRLLDSLDPVLSIPNNDVVEFLRSSSLPPEVSEQMIICLRNNRFGVYDSLVPSLSSLISLKELQILEYYFTRPEFKFYLNSRKEREFTDEEMALLDQGMNLELLGRFNSVILEHHNHIETVALEVSEKCMVILDEVDT
ncbi:hypothetical protein ACED63_23615 [Vibrio splendidus]|uniref:hypothetical protein n=1 Tax=Vibrio splendidus TaxID=29497 RepID=UPI00352D4644